MKAFFFILTFTSLSASTPPASAKEVSAQVKCELIETKLGDQKSQIKYPVNLTVTDEPKATPLSTQSVADLKLELFSTWLSGKQKIEIHARLIDLQTGSESTSITNLKTSLEKNEGSQFFTYVRKNKDSVGVICSRAK